MLTFENVCQLIMGAGKTTVIAPLLAMFLATSSTAVVQVVPASLLEMTRGVMRERFSALVQKPVYTFLFDRSDEVDEAMLRKLEKARASRAVIVASPTSIKSFVLKFTEIIHLLEEHVNAPPTSGGKGLGGFLGFGWGKKGSAAEIEALSSQDLERYKAQAAMFPKILRIFQTGVLLLDEVDLLLHPLKSELNWPLGVKKALDFTFPTAGCSGASAAPGMRWLVALHILDALFFVSTGKTCNDVSDSATAEKMLGDLRKAVMQGVAEKVIQVTPHIVVLDPRYFNKSLHTYIHMNCLVHATTTDTA